MRFYSWRSSRPSLVRLRQATHARHDTENVVVDGVQAEEERVCLVGVRTKRRLSVRRRGHAVKDKRGIVNAGEVAGSARLMVLGLNRKRVDVNRVLVSRTLARRVSRCRSIQAALGS